MKKFLKYLIDSAGYTLHKKKKKGYIANLNHRRLKMLLDYLDINLILDVGANAGQYAKDIRLLGFDKKIVSFEPTQSAFNDLEANAVADTNWDVFNLGLGNVKELKNINISKNSVSSSFLNMLPTHIKSAPQSSYIGVEEIQIETLDSILPNISNNNNNIFLKIDTQGYERFVLEGAKESLKEISLIQLEMSLKPLYEGEMLYLDMIQYLEGLNFELCSIENGFYNKSTGRLLQIDGVFINKNKIEDKNS